MHKSDKDSCGNDVWIESKSGFKFINPNIDFWKWEEYVEAAQLDIFSKDPETDLLDYPIKYLNDALLGISKSELVVIGADTGIGKTALANEIAFKNAEKGKKVYLFSLEGDSFDVINRIRYKYFCEIIKSTNRKDIDLDYRKFIFNMYNNVFEEINEVDKILKRKYKTLKVYGGGSSMSIDKLISHLDMIEDMADLVVVDHLQYFNFMSNNEHSEITEILKKIQQKKKQYRVPFVIVSHLRKKGKDRGFPENDDFHGSSNIAKQADTCIILSHVNFEDEDSYEKQIASGIYQTGIRITKSRTGLSQRIVGVINFNLEKRKYEESYNLAIALPLGVKKMDIANYPKWAKKSVCCTDLGGKK